MINSLYPSLLGGGIASQNAAQSQSYAQALGQAQNYQSQSPTALAQAYQAQLGMNSINGSAAQAYTASMGRNRIREGTVVGEAYPPTTSMELDHPAYDAPVSVLIDMWVVRFGNDWVDIETIDNDDFFKQAFKRLKGMGELEVHYLTDRSRYVCRKPK